METTSELTLKRLLQLMRKKKTLFFISSALVTTCMIFVSYLLPKTYEAKSVIFIEGSVLNELIKSVTVMPSVEDKIKALSVVMKSRSLILKVMSDLNLDLVNKGADAVEGAISSFQERTQITMEVNKANSRNMDLFVVSFKDSDPKLASNYVNALVRRYIEDNLSQNREEAYGASKFLLDQISMFKQKLDKIENSLANQRRVKHVPEKAATLYERLQPLLKKRDELLSQYTENHPEVIKLKTEIEQLESQIRATTSAATGPDAGLLDLERERETTKKIYEDLLATLRKSEVSAQLEVQDKAGAFRILDPAIVPKKPLSPNMVRMILLAIALGLGAGVGMLILVDNNDPSVKSVETLKKIGLPVLAVISTMQTEQQIAADRRKNRILYAAAGIYFAALLTVVSLEALGLSHMDRLVNNATSSISTPFKKASQKP